MGERRRDLINIISFTKKIVVTLLYYFTLLPPPHFIHTSFPRQTSLRLRTNEIKGLIYYHKLWYRLPLTSRYTG